MWRGVALTGSDLSVEHLLRTQRLKTRQVQNWAVGWLLKCFPSFRDSCLGTNISAFEHRHSWVQRHVCVWVYRVFRGMEKGKLWKTALSEERFLLLWIIRWRLTDWAPALSPNRVTCIHTHKFCCLLFIFIYDLMSLFWFCKTLQASSGEFSENLYFHPKQV